MVGHTGVWRAALKAVEAVDECLGKVIKKVKEKDGIAMVTADHGNVEEMFEDGKPKTAHTSNPVPFILIGEDVKLKRGVLGNIAPTILEILDIEKPDEMGCESLIV